MLKFGICSECKKGAKTCKNVQLYAGLCWFHYKVHRAKECAIRNADKPRKPQKPLERRKNIQKVRNNLQLSEITRKNPQKPAKNAALNPANLVSWYEARLNEFTGICAECGEPINRKYCYASVAHVLPKKKGIGGIPSVATHKENSIELGATCGCHNKYDRNWESASKMKIFPLAVEKFKKIEPFIAEEERKYIPEVFLKFIS